MSNDEKPPEKKVSHHVGERSSHFRAAHADDVRAELSHASLEKLLLEQKENEKLIEPLWAQVLKGAEVRLKHGLKEGTKLGDTANLYEARLYVQLDPLFAKRKSLAEAIAEEKKRLGIE